MLAQLLLKPFPSSHSLFKAFAIFSLHKSARRVPTWKAETNTHQDKLVPLTSCFGRSSAGEAGSAAAVPQYITSIDSTEGGVTFQMLFPVTVRIC